MKDSCVFYRDWIEGIKTFEPSLRLELIEAVIFYSLNGEVPKLSAQATMLFSLLRPKIDRDNEKYELIKKRRSEAGKKHRGNQYTSQNKNGTNGTSVPNTEQNGTNGTDNVNDNDSQEPKGSMSKDSTLLTEGMSHSDADATRPKTIRETVIAYFNEKMSGKEIKTIRSIADGTQRAEWLKKRVKQYGLDGVLEMIDKAADSSFLNGNNKRGWVATFDWLVRPNNFPKVWDGNYDDDKIEEATIKQNDWQS